MKTFNDFKQQVAEERGYQGLETMEREFFNLFQVINEAAELYAQYTANEKVREDRKKVWHTLNPRFSSAWDKSGYVYMSQVIDVHDNLPLPFPEQP